MSHNFNFKTGNKDRYSERHLNSLQIITYLSAGEILSKKYNLNRNNNYLNNLNYLYYQHGYKQNILNVKMTNPQE